MRNRLVSKLPGEGHANDAQDTAIGWYGNVLIVKTTVDGEVLDFTNKDITVALEVLEK